ncbi:MAG: hypothetical protein KDK36_00110, partial [Leptospiraceae bacterium]|nr:hypothetical protein [Leptospiraceae bacterium]
MRKLNYPIYKIILYVILLFSLLVNINAKESEYFLEEHKFISYGKLPTWKGVCTDWNTSPKSFIYDRRVFKGHSDFISKGLGKKINFEEFRKK